MWCLVYCGTVLNCAVLCCSVCVFSACGLLLFLCTFFCFTLSFFLPFSFSLSVPSGSPFSDTTCFGCLQKLLLRLHKHTSTFFYYYSVCVSVRVCVSVCVCVSLCRQLHCATCAGCCRRRRFSVCLCLPVCCKARASKSEFWAKQMMKKTTRKNEIQRSKLTLTHTH